MMQRIKTGDGSHTIIDQITGEGYHSTFGAFTESRHIFLEAGYNHSAKDPIRLFEAGFGTGLNALLTCAAALKEKRKTFYFTIDNYPLPEPVWSGLNHPRFVPDCSAGEEFYKAMHQADWEKPIQIHPWFTLHKHKSDLTQVTGHIGPYDLVYFDAFSPARQPLLWQREIFELIFYLMPPGGLLVTYSVRGEVQRCLKSIGFYVEKLPGPAGKREFLRATKPLQPKVGE